MNSYKQIKVWDLPVRVFHWSLACAFFVAYLTEDDFMSWHVVAGYIIGGLILFRLLWGFIGTSHARFTDFVYPPATVIAYLKRVVGFRAERHLGHNPAGGAMVIVLLMFIVITVLTGLVAYGGEHSAGPLAGFMASMPHAVEESAEDLHEFFANFTLLLVFLHLGGVLLASLQHKENLVRSMVTGLKRESKF